MKQLHTFLGLFVHERASVPHLAQVFRPLYSLVKRGVNWDLPPTLEQAFQGGTCIIKHTQALYALDPARPCELDMYVTQECFGWGLWRQLCQPLGFWSQLWKGAEVWYSLAEKQLASVYAALLATEAITGTGPMTVRAMSHCRVGLGLDGQALEWDGSDTHIG